MTQKMEAKKQVSVMKFYFIAFILTLSFLFFNAVAGIAMLPFDFSPGTQKLTLSVAFILPTVFIGFLLRKYGPGVNTGLFTGPDRRGAVLVISLLCLAGGLAGQYASMPLEWISLISLPGSDIYLELLEQLMPDPADYYDQFAFVLTVGIIGPVCEELIFRGFLLQYMFKNLPGKVHGPVIFTGLLFGLAHANPWQFAYAFPLGVFLGYLMYYTGSVVFPVLFHIATNLTAGLITILLSPGHEMADPTAPPPWEYVIPAYIYLAVLMAAAIRFYRQFRETTSPTGTSELH